MLSSRKGRSSSSRRASAWRRSSRRLSSRAPSSRTDAGEPRCPPRGRCSARLRQPALSGRARGEGLRGRSSRDSRRHDRGGRAQARRDPARGAGPHAARSPRARAGNGGGRSRRRSQRHGPPVRGCGAARPRRPEGGARRAGRHGRSLRRGRAPCTALRRRDGGHRGHGGWCRAAAGLQRTHGARWNTEVVPALKRAGVESLTELSVACDEAAKDGPPP